MTPTRSNSIAIVIIVIILVIALFFTWSSVKKINQAKQAATPAGIALTNDEGAPYTDLEGNPIELSDFLGEVLVVSSWASWCPFCSGELSKLAEISREYKGKEVKVIGINRAEPATTAQRFLEYAKVSDDVMLVLDPDDKYFKSIGGYTMPETVIYDREGNIIHHWTGELLVSDVRAYIEEAQNP